MVYRKFQTKKAALILFLMVVAPQFAFADETAGNAIAADPPKRLGLGSHIGFDFYEMSARSFDTLTGLVFTFDVSYRPFSIAEHDIVSGIGLNLFRGHDGGEIETNMLVSTASIELGAVVAQTSRIQFLTMISYDHGLGGFISVKSDSLNHIFSERSGFEVFRKFSLHFPVKIYLVKWLNLGAELSVSKGFYELRENGLHVPFQSAGVRTLVEFLF